MITSISGSQIMDVPELRARRMIAQLLAPSEAHPLHALDCRPARDRIHVATQWMTATQAQLRGSGLRAIAVRAHQPVGLVQDAVNSGAIVRSWSQRGTHHLLAAEDVRWVTRLCSPRVQRDSAKRQPGLGFTEGQVDTARAALVARLSELKPLEGLPRSECYAVFRKVGVDPDQQRGPHLLRFFGGEGDIVQGPPVGAAQNEDTFLLHDRLPHTPLTLSGYNALRSLAARYINARGPVTPQDFAWWAWVTVRDAKRGFELARESGDVDTCEVECVNSPKPSTTMYLGSWQAGVVDKEIKNALRQELHLPAFDEYLISYKDRSHIIDPRLTPEVGPTKNGMCRPFIVQTGEITAQDTPD